jgi:hypothetical protein
MRVPRRQIADDLKRAVALGTGFTNISAEGSAPVMMPAGQRTVDGISPSSILRLF